MSTFTSHSTRQAPATTSSVAELVTPLVHALVGDDPPIRVEFWDGSGVGPPASRAAGALHVRSADALRRIMWSPNELGLARAYVAGDLDVDGDLFRLIEALRDSTPDDMRFGISAAPAAARAARKLGLIAPPLPPPPEEVRLKGWRHSLRR
ncbi:MAG: SAM-dependent methyltransferase, partial [Ilumatobacteraceae bacterium]